MTRKLFKTQFNNILCGSLVHILSYICVAIVISIYASYLSYLSQGAPSPEKLNEFMYLYMRPIGAGSSLFFIFVICFRLRSKHISFKISDSIILSTVALIGASLTLKNYGFDFEFTLLEIFNLSLMYTVAYLGWRWGKKYQENAPIREMKQIENRFKIYNLSKREIEIVLELQDGKSNKQIGEKLFIEEGTVKNHLKSIFKKTEVESRLELITLILN